MFISWKHQDTDFPGPLSIEEKVSVFYERVWGWQLHIADLCLNGGCDHDHEKLPHIPHSAFAAMQIMLSYFEMIAKYEDGFVPPDPTKGFSAKYFKAGVKSVFPEQFCGNNQADIDSFLDVFYKKVRCGLYHMAQTKAGIVFTGEQRRIFHFDPKSGYLVVNPHALPNVLKEHLKDYCNRLRSIVNVELRKKFELRYDYDN